MKGVIIKTRPNLEDSFKIEKVEYEALRTRIIDKLLTVFDKVEYADAGWTHFELVCNCIKFHGKGLRCVVNTFNIEEWYYYSDMKFERKIKDKLDWCINENKVLDPDSCWSTTRLNVSLRKR